MAARSRKVRAGEAGGEEDLEVVADSMVEGGAEARRAPPAKGVKQQVGGDWMPGTQQQQQQPKATGQSGDSGGGSFVASGVDQAEALEPGENVAASDLHADRRLMGAAATVGGAAGMLMSGPVAGVALGAAALYAATREGSSGTLARKVGSMYLQAADRAMDGSLEAVDQGVKKIGQAAEKGRQRLSKEEGIIASMPAPVRDSVERVLNSTSSQKGRGSAGSCEEAKKIREKYPDRVPVICERSPYSMNLPELQKKKYVVPGSMLCGEFKYMIHKNLAQALAQGDRHGAEQTIYIFANGIAPKTSTPMSELYEKLRGDDGFLYIKYGAENTLG